MCVFFFFSSRRRHTRCLSDWSSDVCSSDLDTRYRLIRFQLRLPGLGGLESGDNAYRAKSRVMIRCAVARSEERRVGKGVDVVGRVVYKNKYKTVLLWNVIMSDKGGVV